MKILKTILLLFLIIISNVTFSQNNTDKKKTDDQVTVHLEKMKQEIHLTETQETEIRQLLENFYQKRQNAQKKNNKTDNIEEKKRVNTEFKSALEKILTQEQQDTLVHNATVRVDKFRIKSK